MISKEFSDYVNVWLIMIARDSYILYNYFIIKKHGYIIILNNDSLVGESAVLRHIEEMKSQQIRIAYG
jgi:hypothetical protein